MPINDFTLREVRIRQDAEFIDVPNNVQAGEALKDGQFVELTTPDGRYRKVTGQDDTATHLVIKSGTSRKTPTEIANLIGIVQEGEPVLTVTGGPGVVTIPFSGSVINGQELTVERGYAVPWSKDTGATGAYLVGRALEDVSVADGEIAWGDALITLPAQFSQGPNK